MASQRQLPSPRTLRSIGSLRTAEVWLLCSLRLLVRNRGDDSDVDQGFLAAKLPSPLREALRAAVDLISASAERPFDIRPPEDFAVSSDEERFLMTMYALQRGDELTVQRTMRHWLPTAVIRLAVPYLGAVARGMDQAGLRIPSPFQSPCPMLSLATRRLQEMEAGQYSPAQPFWLN